MKAAWMPALATMVLVLAGCGGAAQVCRDEPQPYERSHLGKRVEVPDGLDPLNPSRELTIPEPSPRPPRAADAPCLELPPSFRIEEEEPAQQASGESDAEPDDET
jgi:hypothetical protein